LSVFDEVMDKVENGEFKYIVHKKIMRIAPSVQREVTLHKDDAVCDLCWRDLWFQMVFFYRNLIAGNLPDSVKKRPICYWGINCNTMNHNEDHAIKYNHMVYQTRF
jgi:E3 ubiquitin-protein ligase CHFR